MGASPRRPDARAARRRRQLQLAVAMGAVPADYFEFYYFTDDVLAELRAKPTTRAEDILGWSPDYWRHYEEQAAERRPAARPVPLTRRHPRARARDRRDGRDLQRQGRDPPGQRAERGRRAPGLPRRPRRRGARPLPPGRHRRAPREAAAAARPGSRGDARRVPGARRGDGLERDARRRHPGAQRQPARPPGRGRRARSTTRSRPHTATTCPTGSWRSRGRW